MTEVELNPKRRWVIRHETTYRYSVAVAFAPHLLRLTPRPDSVRTITRSLQIRPIPREVVDFSDTFGNPCTRVTFSPDASNELVIESRIEVESLGSPPVHPIIAQPRLPWTVPDDDPLFSFRERDESPEVATLAQKLAAEVGSTALPFFEHLSNTLYRTIDRQIRIDGPAQTPLQTLQSGRGACRDLSVLFLAVCRALGVAGRFVSGYQGQEASPDGKRHLHAWPEVFVPEVGWVGWDPTHGVPVGAGHVALCAAPNQGATMPIEGGFYFNGPTVSSTLSYSISFYPV